MSNQPIDAEFVIYRLEEAGRTLLSLPNVGCMPAGYKSNWPEVVHAALEAYGYTPEMAKAPCPSPKKIGRMDEAMRWVAFIPEARSQHRRIVLMRSLVHPITERHRWSWRRLGDTFGWDRRAVQLWHGQGIDMIVNEMRRRNVDAA